MTSETTARLRPVAGLSLLLMLAACAASPERPDQDLTRAEAAIDQAEQAGARQYGPVVLDDARSKLAQARTAVAEEEMLVAQRYAEEAALAADLAAAKARTGKAERAVDQLEKSIAVLREEIARNERLEGETG
ncbi:MAG TPA: DUF4398 domain-containing protein [Woeseiaceae bacterium]|nr:DUF4398 domain-containing protein [Woeseiaceae bacterium]